MTIGGTSAHKFFDPLVDLGVSPILWLDSSVASSFSYSSGSVVSQWNDLGPVGNHMAQATTGKQPTRTGTQNGLDVVAFAAGKYLRCVNTAPITVAFTMFSVFRKTGSAQTFETGPLDQSNGSTARPLGIWNSSRFFSGSGTQYGGFLNMQSQTSWLVFSQTLNSVTYDEWKDGAVATSTMTHNQTFSSTSGKLTMFSRDDEGTQLVGDAAEFLVYPELSNTKRKYVEGYLKGKWGTP